MKSSIRLIVVSVVIWFGLSAGSANAKTDTISFVDNGTSFDGAFFNNAITSSPFSDIFNFTIPTGAIGTGGSSVISGFNFTGPQILFDSFTVFDVTTGLTVATGGSASILSNLVFSGQDITHDFQLLVNGQLLTGVSSGGYSGNLSISPVPEPETYAMLLIGLGLVAFTARRRRKYELSY